jgi:hypothetical protein
MYKYLTLFLILIALPFCVKSQIDGSSCAICESTSKGSLSFGNHLLKNHHDPSGLIGADSCRNNNISANASSSVKKIVPVTFYVIQDEDGERNFPDDPSTVTLLEDVIDRANFLLNNNQPISHPTAPQAPPVQNININFEYQAVEYRELAGWPGYDGAISPWTNLSTNGLNVVCREVAGRWAPTPELANIVSVQEALCGQSTGGFTFGGLTPGREYVVFARLNGSTSQLSWPGLIGNTQGQITASGLAAGSYTDVYIQEAEYGQTTRDFTISIKNTGAPKIKPGPTTSPTNCTSGNGSFAVQVGGAPNGSIFTLHYRVDGQQMSQAVQVAGGFVTVNNQNAGHFTDIRLESTFGCFSNSLIMSIANAGTPTIGVQSYEAEGIKQLNGDVIDGAFTISGLNTAEEYTIYVRSGSSGSFESSDLALVGSAFRHSPDFDSEENADEYFEFYISRDDDCARSNTLRIRPGLDKKPQGIGGVANNNSTYLSVFEMYHRYLYKIGTTLPDNPGHPYTTPESLSEYINTIAHIIIHEFGHNLNLGHVFNTDLAPRGYVHCDDIQITSSCSQNNFMDNVCGQDKRAFSPCQIQTMHNYLTEPQWDGRFSICGSSPIVSSMTQFIDYSNGVINFSNNFNSTNLNVEEIFTIRSANDPGVDYFSETPILQLSLMRFAGQTFEICVNTIDVDGCLGVEDCQMVTIPNFTECAISQVGYIELELNTDGKAISLDPSSSPNKGHYWTYSSQNGTVLSETCVHDPDIIYSELAEYAGDVLEVCLSVLGTNYGTPCTTRICTTFIIPPIYPSCSGTPAASSFRHYLDEDSEGDGFIGFRKTGYSTPFYEHRWIVYDRIGDETNVYTGSSIDLYEFTDFQPDDRRIDLRMCHIVWHTINQCIVASSCQDVQYDCRRSYEVTIDNLAFDASTQSLVFEYAHTTALSIEYVEIFVNNSLSQVVPVQTGSGQYSVSIPVSNPCGTATIELNVGLLHATTIPRYYCSYEATTITYGPQPCKIQATPGVASGGKREGLQAQGYSLRLAPNPTQTGFTNLLLQAEESEAISISLHDMFGKEVKRFTASVDQGDNKIRLDFPGLAPGMYLLHVNGRKQQSIKLVIDN